MRPIFAAAILLVAGAAAAPSAGAAAPNDIIWDTPAPKTTPKGGDVSKETMTPPAAEGRQTISTAQPDKNGIIWDTPASANPAVPSPQAAKPDANGITWNAPPVKPSSASSAPNGPLLTPPSGRLAQAPSATDAPCREFQTTIVIDGKREPAHGTACQQADGTWRVVNK